MDCNNTLTDAQLKALFVTTDKERRQIEQPMDCPIRRSQHEWNKCARFFSNEAALK